MTAPEASRLPAESVDFPPLIRSAIRIAVDRTAAALRMSVTASDEACRIGGEQGNEHPDLDTRNKPVWPERLAVRLGDPQRDRDRDEGQDRDRDWPARLDQGRLVVRLVHVTPFA